MKTQELHEKRRRRTSLKKADQYRAEAAFFKQRNTTLENDLINNGRELSKTISTKEVLNKDINSLRSDYINLRNEMAWIKNLWLVRFSLWALGKK